MWSICHGGPAVTMKEQCTLTRFLGQALWAMATLDNKSQHFIINIHNPRSRKSFNQINTGINTGCTCAITDSQAQCTSTKFCALNAAIQLYNANHHHPGAVPSVRDMQFAGSAMCRKARPMTMVCDRPILWQSSDDLRGCVGRQMYINARRKVNARVRQFLLVVNGVRNGTRLSRFLRLFTVVIQCKGGAGESIHQ